jgi:hypothetical protein
MCQQNYLCNVPNSSFPCIYIYLTLYYKLKHESIAIAKLKDNMEGFDDEIEEPVSPTGQYLNSSSLSVCILGVLESEIPIDDKQTMSLLQDVFLPINTRFSSIMVIKSCSLHSCIKYNF